MTGVDCTCGHTPNYHQVPEVDGGPSPCGYGRGCTCRDFTASAPAADAGVVREEWAVWDPTHTSNPNDDTARTRRLRDQAAAEDYVTMPKAKRVRIARKLVTEGPWIEVADTPADQPTTKEQS